MSTPARPGPALKALARRSAIPVELDVNVQPGLAAPIEVATYYVVSEALDDTGSASLSGQSKAERDQRGTADPLQPPRQAGPQCTVEPVDGQGD